MLNISESTGSAIPILVVTNRIGNRGWAKLFDELSFKCELSFLEVCKYFNISCCEVTQEVYDGKLYSVSWFGGGPRVLTTHAYDLDIISIQDAQSILIPEIFKDFLKMVFVDCICANIDRHGFNCKFILDHMGQIKGLYPLYDNEMSFVNSISNTSFIGIDQSKVYTFAEIYGYLKTVSEIKYLVDSYENLTTYNFITDPECRLSFKQQQSYLLSKQNMTNLF